MRTALLFLSIGASAFADVSHARSTVKIPKDKIATKGMFTGTADVALGLALARKTRAPIIMIFTANW